MAPRLMPELQSNQDYLTTNPIVQTTTMREAAPSDVSRRATEIAEWDKANAHTEPELEAAEAEYRTAIADVGNAPTDQQASDSLVNSLQTSAARLSLARAALAKLGNRPKELTVGTAFPEMKKSGGKSIFWPGGVKPVDENGNVLAGVVPVAVNLPTKKLLQKWFLILKTL